MALPTLARRRERVAAMAVPFTDAPILAVDDQLHTLILGDPPGTVDRSRCVSCTEDGFCPPSGFTAHPSGCGTTCWLERLTGHLPGARATVCCNARYRQDISNIVVSQAPMV